MPSVTLIILISQEFTTKATFNTVHTLKKVSRKSEMNFLKILLFVSMVESSIFSDVDRDLRIRVETQIAYIKCTFGIKNAKDPVCKVLRSLLCLG